jgi:signal transduction histidine kinase
LQFDLDQARSDMNKAISQRMALAVQLDDKHRALATLQEALEANEAELETLRQESETQMAQLQQEVKRLREQLDRSGTQPLARLKRTGLLSPVAEKRSETATSDQEVIHSLTQELRQPISSIGGYADLLLNESAGILGALQRKFLERIKASTERMGVLLDDLIHVTAAGSGTLEFKAEHLDVGEVIEEALTSSAAHFRERGIELALNIMPDLPALNADRDAVRQIFSHLLNNAVAASQPDSVVTLTVRREADPNQRIGDATPYLFIAVQDTGGGIAPEDQPRVFSRLYRADAPLVAGVGDTGVGLSMVKTLVEAHQGKVWVMSEAGVGSTFNVLLPLDRSAPKINGALPTV